MELRSPRPSLRLKRYRTMAFVLLALQLQACTTWQPVTVAPRQLIQEEQPKTVRVTRADGSQETMRAPYLSGDSILSVRGGELVAVPLDDVQRLEVGRSGAGQGTAFALLGLAVVVVALIVSYQSSLGQL